ncbi:hypothetical protein EVG20_g3941, partial [Dentipellis fragilis]
MNSVGRFPQQESNSEGALASAQSPAAFLAPLISPSPTVRVGFGLLWCSPLLVIHAELSNRVDPRLAATLGAKSSFKKLPKRDVLGANISQLCGLITNSDEPLALRLSSNLMVGVARVYKGDYMRIYASMLCTSIQPFAVKHEIFLGDVTACFAALKKAVQDFQALSASSATLQMGQPSVRPDTVTLAADPAMALGLNMDNFLAANPDSDDEYGKPKKAGKKPAKKSVPFLEQARENLHTLNENLEQMLSGSFDVSFLGSAIGGMDPSSSQIDGGLDFGFEDNIFAPVDGLDLGDGIGDELAKELGDGWGAPPADIPEHDPMIVDDAFNLGLEPESLGMALDEGPGFSFAGLNQPSEASSATKRTLASASKKRTFEEFERENTQSPIRPMALSPAPAVMTPPGMDMHEPEVPAEIPDPETMVEVEVGGKKPPRKPKRVRLLLDARTELTDEELKAARAHYVEEQETLRREMEEKKLEKESGRLIEEMLWAVPQSLRAPILVDFWLENFKVKVEARSGALHFETKGSPPKKRRRTAGPNDDEQPKEIDEAPALDAKWDAPMQGDMDFEVRADEEMYPGPVDTGFGSAHQRSSEEPGQARRVSRPPSPLDGAFAFGFGRDTGVEAQGGSVSQKSSLFPWDNAGPSSSVGGPGGAHFEAGSDRVSISIGRAESRLRGSSGGRSRRESSLIPSHVGVGGMGFSPGQFVTAGSQFSGDNFEFNVPAEAEVPANDDSQMTDANLVTLERNSFNFLEYAKMQTQTLAQPEEGLCFDDVVPKNTSTPHVAASAFYHCLVLATKDLIRVVQPEAYGPVMIHITYRYARGQWLGCKFRIGWRAKGMQSLYSSITVGRLWRRTLLVPQRRINTASRIKIPLRRPFEAPYTENHAQPTTTTHARAMSNVATIASAQNIAQTWFADIDLSSYDAEQSRLMEERCILVDEQDNAIGAADKKT